MLRTENTRVYFGPPGTGKTTTLMDVVEQLLDDGVKPMRIAYVAFTRAAANEAKNRCYKRFKINARALPYWGTLHSIAYAQLGMSQTRLMTGRHWDKLGHALGMSLVDLDESGRLAPSWSRDKGRLVQSVVSIRRARHLSIDLDELQHEYPPDDAQAIDLYNRSLEKYKRIHELLDYADLIDQAPGQLPVDACIVDEAQDLTPAQWNYVHRLVNGVGRVFVAGDDDQSIYEWAGADVDTFLDVPGERVVLDQSYRLPTSIWQVADSIAQRIQTRQQKTWRPSDRDGHVARVHDVDQVDVRSGEWLLLARTRYLLDRWAEHCRLSGVRYVMHGRDSVDASHVQSIRAYEALRAGKRLTGENVLQAFEYTPSKPTDIDAEQTYTAADLKLRDMPVWHSVMTRIPDSTLKYYESCLRNHSRALTEPPRVRIMTIHACKGREADNVGVLTDVSARVARSIESHSRDSDAEHRVWYVAVTRARNFLAIVSPTDIHHYTI